MSSYLWSVLCKYPDKLIRVRLAAFSQQPRAQQLSPLRHLNSWRRSVNKQQRGTDDTEVLTKEEQDELLKKRMSDLGVGDPLVGLPRFPEAKTRAIS